MHDLRLPAAPAPCLVPSAKTQGVTGDSCYLAEQSRHLSRVGAAGKQALVNAPFSQEEHKSAAKAWRYKDVVVSRDKLGIVSIDGKPAVMNEENNGAQVFVTGMSNVIFTKTVQSY